MNAIRLFSGCLTLMLLLSGCGSETSIDAPDLRQKVESERTLEKDVSFSLETVSESADTVIVRILLQNPSQQNLVSLRSWLTFPAGMLEGKEMTLAKNSFFQLTAPGENTFDNVLGMAKIGIALDENFSDETTEVATVSFLKKQEGTAPVSFFDAHAKGHTDALISFEGELRSVLQESALVPLLLEL